MERITEKHTPGEWDALENGVHIKPGEGMHEVHALTPSGQIVMICQLGEGYFSEHGKDCEYHLTMAEQLANAALISAAPDLLEALQNCLDLGYLCESESTQARAAIAKAKAKEEA